MIGMGALSPEPFMLYQGDCLAGMRDLPDACVDAVIADPPYGLTACKWDAVIPFAPMWEALRRIVRPKAAIVLTASQPFTSALVMSNAEAFHQALVWTKNKPSGHLNAKHRHLTAHEDVLVFADGCPTYHPQKWTSSPAHAAKKTKPSSTYGKERTTEYAGGQKERFPTTALKFSVVNNDGTGEARTHPTQKPVALMEYLVRTYTNPDAIVLDFAMGSGTTGVACARAGRHFIGMELDPQHYAIAERRITEAYSTGPKEPTP